MYIVIILRGKGQILLYDKAKYIEINCHLIYVVLFLGNPLNI